MDLRQTFANCYAQRKSKHLERLRCHTPFEIDFTLGPIEKSTLAHSRRVHMYVGVGNVFISQCVSYLCMYNMYIQMCIIFEEQCRPQILIPIHYNLIIVDAIDLSIPTPVVAEYLVSCVFV